MMPRVRFGGWAVVLNVALMLLVLQGGTRLLVSSLTVKDEPVTLTAQEVMLAARHQRAQLWQNAPELKRANHEKERMATTAAAAVMAVDTVTTTPTQPRTS